MLLNLLFLVSGLALILVGANALTDGASALARRWGVSDLVVGLTVVAFGTSAPELAISVLSAIGGSAGLAVGNVVGSNIFNLLCIIGVVALCHPVRVEKSLLANDIPLVLLSSAALLAIGGSAWLGVAGAPEVNRTDALLLILFFAIFLHYTFSRASRSSVSAAGPPQEEKAAQAIPAMKLWKALLWVVGGLAMLISGGNIFVRGASGLASAFGVSEDIIGLTIVAAGTSLPELAASVVAARKGKTGIAVGNVIGSCLFNAFLVLGTSALVRPLPFGDIGAVDLLTLTGASLLFWLFGCFFGKRVINRVEGALLTLGYIVYIVYLCC